MSGNRGGGGRVRGKGKGKVRERTALAEVDPTAMEVAAEVEVHTSASETALGGQAPTGVGPPLPLRATLPGDGQHGHHDATRSKATTQPTPSLTQHQQRRESKQLEQHRTPAMGGGNAATTSVCPSPRADRAPHANSPPNGNLPSHSQPTADTQQPPNAPAGGTRSPIVRSHQYAYEPMPFPLNTLPPTAHSNTIHSRHSPGSNRPPTPNPVQTAASTTDVTSVDSVAVRGYSHPNPVSIEHQRPDKSAVIWEKIACPFLRALSESDGRLSHLDMLSFPK